MSGLQAAIVDQLRRLRELEEAIAVELRKSVADFDLLSDEEKRDLVETYIRSQADAAGGGG